MESVGLQRELQREIVAPATQATDSPNRNVRKKGLAPERLPGLNVGQMNFDKRNSYRRQGVAQRNAGMGEPTWIDHDESIPLHLGVMHPLNQGTLVVALKALKGYTVCLGEPSKTPVYVLKGFISIDLRLTGPQEVQVWSMQHEDLA